MTSPAVVRAERLSKSFDIDEDRHSDATLRDAIAGGARALLDAAASVVGPERPQHAHRTTLWALKDVSFELQAGDIVGVIGRNGAGKSTLLKILSRITEPSSGRVGINGRVGSLLEVGTGFHPELTGRENVYLYGSILGMHRAEIRRRFDDIVGFAEVGPQLDTPIKRYSSGMQVRLAFSVAAYLEPEILLVDEVLAVGDVAFQKRCLGKMGEVASEGRTVIFVSHNMALIRALCKRGMLLERGALRFDGSIEDTVDLYLRGLEQAMATDVGERTDRKGRQDVKLIRVEFGSGADGAGMPTTGAGLSLAFLVSSAAASTTCSFGIHDSLGNLVAEFRSSVGAPGDRDDGETPGRFVCAIDQLPLVPGRYRIDVEIRSANRLQDAVEAAAMFDVEEGLLAGRPIDRSWSKGTVAVRHHWTTPAA